MELTIVDAFTDVPFSGNPAAVAILEEAVPEQLMQQVAAEMNLAETAFAYPLAPGGFALRWFTPTVEVDLCGHATLATAHVLGGSGTFNTKCGVLVCTRADDGRIEMDLPTNIPTSSPMPSYLAGCGATAFATAGFFVLAEFEKAADVRDFVPDLGEIARLPAEALLITARSDRPEFQCCSRVFAPKVGIAEDPVTGSAGCVLGPYWGGRLGLAELVGEQASPRGGIVTMRRFGDRTVVGGHAVTVAHTTLTA